MGIIIALGTITMFNNYKTDVLSNTRVEESKSIGNNVKQTILDMQGVNGSSTVDLEPRIGGQDYRITVGENIDILYGSENYSTSLNGMENLYEFRGSADGGPITIYKTGNEYTVRPD